MTSNLPKSFDPELSQRLDETVIATQKNDDEAEEVEKPTTKGMYVCTCTLAYRIVIKLLIKMFYSLY